MRVRVSRFAAGLAVATFAFGCGVLGPRACFGQATEGPMRPFSKVAIGVALSTQGPGAEIAVPLSRDFNLRGGADIFKFSDTFTSSGVSFGASLALESGQVSLDWFPFHGSFRISPGAMVYNATNVSASLTVAQGQSFKMNDVTYYASSTAPLTGTVGATWPKAGPRITFGFGNMVPRKASKHVSLTSEFGMAYFGTGTVSLGFVGTECHTANTPSSCQTAASDTGFQTNVTAEQAKYQKNMVYARFYPILKTGLSVKF